MYNIKYWTEFDFWVRPWMLAFKMFSNSTQHNSDLHELMQCYRYHLFRNVLGIMSSVKSIEFLIFSIDCHLKNRRII